MDRHTFDRLTVSLATGSSRRRLLAGFGAVTMGALLGREGDAKSSRKKGNKKGTKKGTSATNGKGNADMGTSTGTETASVPVPDPGTTPEPAPETDGEVGILAKDLCTVGGTQCQDDLGPTTCLIGTCVKQNNRARCEYTRNPSACTDPSKPVCCNYRLGSSTSGQCVQAGPEGNRNAYCAA